MTQKDISFDGRKVRIVYTNREITALLKFLFNDIQDISEDTILHPDLFKIIYNPKRKKWKLKHADKSLFNGESLEGLGVILMGEVLFHLICDNDRALAIHAGLISDDNKTILIPGTSGSGKTSVTTWYVSNGMRYHTDELVTIDLESHQLKAFTRPLSVKSHGLDAIKDILDFESLKDHVRASKSVTMIPHRLVNPDFITEIPDLTHILFPKYIADSKPEIIKLSGAEAGLEMMRSNVIARNLPSHGFGQIIKLVKGISAYRLHYQHFDNLPDLIKQI